MELNWEFCLELSWVVMMAELICSDYQKEGWTDSKTLMVFQRVPN